MDFYEVIMDNYNNIGFLYDSKGEYSNSSKYFNQALLTYKKTNNLMGIKRLKKNLKRLKSLMK